MASSVGWCLRGSDSVRSLIRRAFAGVSRRQSFWIVGCSCSECTQAFRGANVNCRCLVAQGSLVRELRDLVVGAGTPSVLITYVAFTYITGQYQDLFRGTQDACLSPSHEMLSFADFERGIHHCTVQQCSPICSAFAASRHVRARLHSGCEGAPPPTPGFPARPVLPDHASIIRIRGYL